MAFTRKFLTALGIEPEKIDEIINSHAEVVDALKDQRDEYKEDASKLKDVQKELDDLKKAVGDGNEGPYKQQYEDLKAEYDEYKEGVEAEKLTAKTKGAYRELLKEAGVSEKRLDAILKVTDLSDVKLDNDGKIDGASKLTESIKTEWADFIEKKDTKGIDTETPPGSKGTGDGMTKAKIMAIKDRSERQAAIAAHPDLFGIQLSGGKE